MLGALSGYGLMASNGAADLLVDYIAVRPRKPRFLKQRCQNGRVPFSDVTLHVTRPFCSATLIGLRGALEAPRFPDIEAGCPDATAPWHPPCSPSVCEGRPLPIRAHPS